MVQQPSDDLFENARYHRQNCKDTPIGMIAPLKSLRGSEAPVRSLWRREYPLSAQPNGGREKLMVRLQDGEIQASAIPRDRQINVFFMDVLPFKRQRFGSA